MNRRKFIKQSCFTCASMLALGTIPALLNSCATLPTLQIKNYSKVLAIDKAQFFNTQTKTSTNIILLQPAWMEFDILLVHNEEDDSYNAVSMKCSHEAYKLTPTHTAIYCSAHGSQFRLNGDVQKEPATKPLQKFQTKISDNKILIYLT